MVSPHPVGDHHEGASSSMSHSVVDLHYLRDHQGLGAHDIPSTSKSTREKINDSVYRLYSPSKVDMDVLFFHGLQLYGHSAPHESTWEARCPGAPVWPRQWLSEDYPGTRVLTISYDGSIRKSDRDGRMDLYLIVERVLQDLLNAGVGKFGPVILVGHSFGGLVIKRLCLFLAGRKDEKSLAFLQQIRGIFYFATPHQGGFTAIIEQLNTEKGELVKLVKELNVDLARINHEFQNLCSEHKLWHIAGVGETLATDLLLEIHRMQRIVSKNILGPDPETGDGSSSVIVKEASARCGNNFVFVEEDHFSICQPREKTSSTYQFFVDFIDDVRGILSTVTTEFEDLEGDRQIMPPTSVGVLESWEGGEIGRRLESNSALGLWGTGGIGKTTLAKAIFNRKRSNFEFTLFAEDVKSMPGTNSIQFVEKLLERVHRRGEKVVNISGKSLLKGKDILVVLDDVDCKDDQDDRDIRLVHELRDICSPNSRFILTSRNNGILDRVGRISIVELTSLDDDSSERLFRSYAIPCSNDDLTLMEWQQKCLVSIVKHCGGLPLLLEVVGRYLKISGEKGVWEETSRALLEADKKDAVGIDVLWSKLKVSYDSLGEEEKNMFIDAATFFQEGVATKSVLDHEHGGYGWFDTRQWSLREAKAAWGITYGIVERRWKTLVDRSLVSAVKEDSPIKMHEHLLHFGRWLGMREGKRIGIVENRHRYGQKSVSDDLHERIQNHQLQDIHTIQSVYNRSEFSSKPWGKSCRRCRLQWRVTGRNWNEDFCPHSIPHVDILDLHRMDNLQYLQLDSLAIAARKMRISLGGKEVRFPPNLVILRFVNIANVSFASCTKLVNLHMVDFGHKHFPSSLCSLKNLQDLYLGARNLKYLPELFGNLINLRHLTLLTCLALERLPDSFDGLKSLQVLELDGCSKLVRMPDSLGNLESLQVLEIKWCHGLVELPDSFGGLRSLCVLKICGCESLVRLPDSFGALKGLQTLELDCCGELVRMPRSLGDLESLQMLKIFHCQKLVELPDSFGGLRSLNVLKIQDCYSLGRLPDSFGDLKGLQTLKIDFNWELVRLPNSLGNLESLQELEICDCNGLVELPDSFGDLRSLRVLKICFCGSLVRLSNSFGGLKGLQMLEIYSCEELMGLPDSLGDLENLQELEICNCRRLVELPDSFGGMRSLHLLTISGCRSLVRLPDSVGRLQNLQELMLIECTSMESLPDSIYSLKNLQLRIRKCGWLVDIP